MTSSTKIQDFFSNLFKKKKLTEREQLMELLEKIHGRLGWIMFWIIVMGLIISSSIGDLSSFLG